MRLKRWLQLSLLISSPAWAYDIFEYQGPYTKAHGGAGVVMSRSGEAVFHNPANLWSTEDSDQYIDFSPSRITYGITTPDPAVKPGLVTVPFAPLLSLGASGKDKASGLAGGIIFIPTGAGTVTKVEEFPLSFQGSVTPANVETKQTGYKLGIGTAYRFGSFSLGLSLIQDFASNETTAVGSEANIGELVAFESSQRSLRPVAGFRYTRTGLGSLGFVYQAAAVQHYSMSVRLVGSKTATDLFRKNYRAAVFGLGLSLEEIGRFAPFGQYTYEKWVPATFLAQAPTQAITGVNAVEYLNAHSYIVGTRYRLQPDRHLMFSYSFFGKNKGAGINGPDGQAVMQGRGGQDFDALDRKHFTGGIQFARKSSDLLFYGSYISGSAVSPPDTPSAGFYELTILMLGGSYVWH